MHWHYWFAWRPVFIPTRSEKWRVVWLRYVERRWTLAFGTTMGLSQGSDWRGRLLNRGSCLRSANNQSITRAAMPVPIAARCSMTTKPIAGISFRHSCHIEDKSEPKRASGFPFVQPFAEDNSAIRGKFGQSTCDHLSPQRRPPIVPVLAQKMRWSWLWITGGSSSAPCIQQLGSFFQPFIDH